MANRRTATDIRFARLSRSGHAETVAMPRDFRAALGWFRGCQLELWIEGDRVIITRARSAREVVDPGPGDSDRPPGR